MIDAALQAFANGMQLAAVASAVLMVAMAAIAYRLLREPRAEAGPDVLAIAAPAPCA